MKRGFFSLAFLTLACLALGASCAKTDAPSASSEGPASAPAATAKVDPSAKALVVVFSATGTTLKVANKVVDATGATLYQIVPKQEYSKEDLDYNDPKSRTSIETNDPTSRPEIASDPIADFADYGTIYIGYPIWWGEAPRIMETFVEAYDFSGKVVVPFCTSGSSDIAESGAHLGEKAGSGDWVQGKKFSPEVEDADMKAWIESLQ